MTATLSPVVLCGPSGSGKSTLIKKLMEKYENLFAFSVSHTTRQPRPGEEDGKDYHFVDRKTMKKLDQAGEFVETAEFSGNMYGTSQEAIWQVLRQGKICLLDINTDGVRSLKALKTKLTPKYVFIKTPSMKILEERLRGRGTEIEEKIEKRLRAASAEIEYGEQPGNFDIIIVNDDLDNALSELEEFLLEDIHLARTKAIKE